MVVEQEFLQVEEGSADVLKEKREPAIPPELLRVWRGLFGVALLYGTAE